MVSNKGDSFGCPGYGTATLSDACMDAGGTSPWTGEGTTPWMESVESRLERRPRTLAFRLYSNPVFVIGPGQSGSNPVTDGTAAIAGNRAQCSSSCVITGSG